MGDRSSAGSRVVWPVHYSDNFHTAIQQEKISSVLTKIEEKRNLDKETSLSHNGFCFGLLDPVSNVIVNSVVVSAAPRPPVEGGGEQDGGDTIIKRSFDGLVAFLTTLFPYLPVAEATEYLDAAGADPLIAALLIIDRRRMRRFGFCSGTTMAAVETALRCAAVASNRPDPQQLVQQWKLLSPHLKNLVSELSQCSPTRTCDAIVRSVLATTKLTDHLQLEQTWELASSRCVSPIPESLPPVRGAVKRMLVSTIYRFYLQALARMPTAELTTRYHHGMLMGGYCYGPLDPVSNIIVNTIWYDLNFSANKQVTLNMVSTKSMARVVYRSFYSLVSFLCTRYPDLTNDLAMQRLQASGANLSVADPNLHGIVHDAIRTNDSKLSWSCCLPIPQCGRRPDTDTSSGSIAEAYFAAANAASHTDPLAHKDFLGSADALHKLKVAYEVLRDGRQLSAKDLEFISMLLCPSYAANALQQKQEPAPIMLKKWVNHKAARPGSEFWQQHERVSEKVKAALDTYNKNMVTQYRLHIICGVNDLVSGPEFSMGSKETTITYQFVPLKYHHSHINFLATCNEGGAPTLFFAECNNYGTENSYWCVPLSPPHPDANMHLEDEQVRCIYCERFGHRIVHPATKDFHGRGIEFERVLRGESPFLAGSNIISYTNDMLIRGEESFGYSMYNVKEDSIYYNFCVDEDDEGTPMDWGAAVDFC